MTPEQWLQLNAKHQCRYAPLPSRLSAEACAKRKTHAKTVFSQGLSTPDLDRCMECPGPVPFGSAPEVKPEWKKQKPHEFDPSIVRTCPTCGKTYPATPDYFWVTGRGGRCLRRECKFCTGAERRAKWAERRGSM